MVEIRELPEGRFEVYAEDRHSEAFEGMLGAIVVAEGLAAVLATESKHPVEVNAPWGSKIVAPSSSLQAGKAALA